MTKPRYAPSTVIYEGCKSLLKGGKKGEQYHRSTP
jgi:hypothetical protein